MATHSFLLMPGGPFLTAQQVAAVVARETSVVLSSGAGCGKTHVLTERYLSHLRDDGAEVGQIVAITFTDRAARQMRERIRAAVVRRVKDEASADEAERWARHLRGLETAQISTIHAFCAALLRQHAAEAGLDPRFDVLEDVLAANLETEALANALQRLLATRQESGDDLRQLILLYGWRAVKEAVQELLRARDVPAWTAWARAPAENVIADWARQARATLWPRHVAYLMAARPKIARCLWQLRQTPPNPGSKMEGNVRLLLETLTHWAGAADPAAVGDQLADLAKVGPERAKAWPADAIYQTVKLLFEEFREEVRSLPLDLFATPPEDAAAAVEVGQRFLRVTAEVGKDYHDLKRRHGVLDFHDLLTAARDLLRDAPHVRARLRQRYRFLLIDELQDTDPVQMELVELLCGVGLTAGMLFAVGDHKQSIYRFRGADVHLFHALRQQVPHAGRLGLTRNFRSQPAVLHFANALLGHRMEDYEPLEPHLPQVNPGPCVEFLWTPRGDKENVTEARRNEADTLARRIVNMVRGEPLVVSRANGHPDLRPVRPGDVVLLFRAMSNVHLYETALRRHGLDYYLVGGRAFFAQQEVYDLLNVLRALENPHDAVSLAGTLRSPFCCLSDEALFFLTRHPDGIWAGLHDEGTLSRLPRDQRAPVNRAAQLLDRWRGLKDRLPIAPLLGELFADSGYDAATQFEFLGDRKLANLWKLQELARGFDRSGLFGLAEFIQRLGDLVRLQPREEQAATQPENADVVRLMSIHQAKGLEFPVVFVPDFGFASGGAPRPVARWDARLGCLVRPPADEEEPPFSDYGWKLGQTFEEVESWHEELRTLYVACTRAQDYLVLSAALKQPFAPTSAWALALAERFDLQTGACLARDVAPESVPQVRVMDVATLSGSFAPVERTRPDADYFPELGEADAEAARPIPVNVEEKRLVTEQFDAEDGSDLNDWPDRRDQYLRGPDAPD